MAKNTLLKQVFSSFFLKILGSFLGFFSTILIARKLGATDSGYYFFSFSIVMIISTISRFGLDHTLLKMIGAQFGLGRSVSNSILTFSLVASFILSVTICIFIYVFLSWDYAFRMLGSEKIFYIKEMLPASILLALLTIVGISFQGERKHFLGLAFLNVIPPFTLISLIFLFYNDEVSVAYFYETSLALSLTLALLLWFKSSNKFDFDKRVYKEVLNSCLPMWVVAFSSILVQWFSPLIIGVFETPDKVAFLLAAQRTSLLISFLLTAVNVIVAPRFAKYYKEKDFTSLENLFSVSTRFLLLISIPLIFLVVVFSQNIMGLFGESFKDWSILLIILSIGQFINLVTGSVGYLLTMTGNERVFRNIILCTSPIYLILTTIMSFYYGVIGSAISTAFFVALQNCVIFYYATRHVEIDFFAFLKK
ncbi:oligosaccharide flippase family protein [Marinomonas sp. NPDC078689]|uniref:oligosaccharide flippase family protein n=1 Tax=Marinomonas sp. NPDC078689 TaxID=3364147 RepID=UPI0037C839DA